MGDLTDMVLISTFSSFPEVILTLLIGFNLSNIKVDFKRIIGISLIQVYVAFVIGLLSIHFGINTIFQLLSLWFLVTIICRIKPYKAIIPVLIGFFISGIVQGIYFSSIHYIYKVDFIRLGAEFKYTILFNMPVFIICILTLMIIKKKRFTLCHINMESEEEYHI